MLSPSPRLQEPSTLSVRSQPAATTPASDSAPRVHSSSASSQENPRSPVATTTGDTVSPAAVVQPSPQPIPYDAKDEPAPAHALFTSTFQDALKDGRKIAQAAVAAIEAAIGTGTAEPDDLLRKLMQDAKGLTKFEGTDTRTIAVLGDSGEGKSSLINSLLHFPGVAQTSDAGSACTAVVTEYRQKKAEHTAPITIEVDYFSASEIAVLVRELLYSYRQLDLPLVQSLEDTSEEVYAKCERESANAWSLLEAAFKHKPQFTMSYARDTSDGALERISSQLIQWANELEWPNNGQEGRWVATATTAEDCVEQTKQFAHDKYWPFTKIIRVYLSSQVLKTGVVLADLPGLQDTNLARVRTTQKYLLKCDNILIVAKISRAITDKSLKSSLFYVLSQHMPLEWEQSGIQKRKVGVVCTKSEEINLKTAKSEFCGPGKIISPETMKHLDEEIESAKSCGDRLRKKSAKKQQQLALVRARAQHVKANLQRIYASKMDGRELQVFCVSNTWYEKYCPKGNQELVQGSGIPDLRRFCHTVAAEMHLNEAKQFLRSRLLGLLESLEVYVRSKMAVITQSDQASKARASRESLSKHLDSVAQENVALTDKFRCDFRSCFEEQILAFFGGRGQHWETAATKEAEKWDNSRINAWCLHNGHHQTARKPRENWNANIIWKMRTELETQWELLEEEAVDVLSAVIEGSKRHLESVKESVRSEAPRDCASPLVSGIDCQLRLLEYESKRLQRDFVEEVKYDSSQTIAY
ncbi:dynamin, GTPase domain-containingprotein [Purpureocillium lilacinum]|uniref:Dynamin, GTPase domain-containingprotein n=1 Tax=Purpureocillium lilacinum TaxID=33203 RepID=A0A179HEE2_PURLI|nr:dynamin, GTPase domain-containingprotein [Purpureocillium lilacinum]